MSDFKHLKSHIAIGGTLGTNYLDLHIVDFCQLSCKHCYLDGGNNGMPLEMIQAICEDFLQTDFPATKQ